jgi:hypothetical protein
MAQLVKGASDDDLLRIGMVPGPISSISTRCSPRTRHIPVKCRFVQVAVRHRAAVRWGRGRSQRTGNEREGG